MRIETERLLLRPFREEDADALQAIAGNDAVALKTSAIPHPYPVNGARHFILHSIASSQTINRFGIFLKKDGVLIGAAACGKAATPSGLAYMIHPHHWGRRYATEAVSAVFDVCFEEIEREVIHSSAMVENDASLRVLKKLGFIETAREPLFLPTRGRSFDTSFQQLARDAWASLKPR